MLYGLVVVISLLVAILGVWIQLIPRNRAPQHLLNFPAFAKENLIPSHILTKLVDLMKELKTFPCNVDQNKGTGFIPIHDDIGEGQPIEKDGTCKHPLLFPNHDGTQCILPQRIDIGKHFLLTGGIDGMKENHIDLISRVSSFGRYTFVNELDNYPTVKELFNSETFQQTAKQVCPNFTDSTVLDPFQFNYIMQVPGQTVAIHLDAPYFWGASRFQYPQWLLVSMVFSGLFQEKFVHQLQVVGYLHNWTSNADSSVSKNKPSPGGEFVYYLSNSDDSVGVVEPITASGTLVDGSKTLHAAKIYRPDVKAPYLDKDKECALTFIKDEDWEILCDGESVAKYTTADLRMSVVYRARCFDNEEEKARYHALDLHKDMIPLDYILETFIKDMVETRGIKKTAQELREMNRLDFANLIMDTYITYPLPSKEYALIPYNYCAVPMLLPWTTPFFKLICN